MAVFFFFKQKTAYERRISDWSSDVCSSDLVGDVTRADIAAEIDELVSVVIADRIVAADIHVEETARKKGRRPVAHQVGREGAGRTVTQIGRASCRERVCPDV